MTEPRHEHGWLSVYLFINGWIYAAECDQVVTDHVEPFVRRCMAEGWADQHFFIRYSEHGPHVRLRLHGRTGVLEGTAWPALVEHVRASHPSVRVDELPETPSYSRADDQPPGVTHLARVAYEPETQRYGGPDALVVAERMFQDSSDTAYALLARMGGERSSRLGKGLLCTVMACHVFCETRERATTFAQNYSTSYLRSLAREDEGRETFISAFDRGFEQQAQTLADYVNEVWERMDEGEELSEALDRYGEGLEARRAELRALFDEGRVQVAGQPVGDWQQVVRGIVPSYVHMMNNRLGITIQEESYLGYLVHRALQSSPEGAEA
ncbi:MAG TPA: thiopeptide-type bacteriocin biosynthesis protein [Longimicrobium sp.]|jgi:thiopeptide-type bacteriocin biosynthesis protein|uniref:thiopeptide-type bacteriocin biosynthesis protein n=1 Tax=Longimicrobium sp. TaxID=2029185 RepID=UPI002ED99E6E